MLVWRLTFRDPELSPLSYRERQSNGLQRTDDGPWVVLVDGGGDHGSGQSSRVEEVGKRLDDGVIATRERDRTVQRFGERVVVGCWWKVSCAQKRRKKGEVVGWLG